MPCIFLQDIPACFNPFRSTPANYQPTEKFNPQLVTLLRKNVAEAAKTNPDGVEIHLSFANHFLLSDNGRLQPSPNVHGFVVWFGQEERDLKVKQTIANALQDFLSNHLIGHGFDLTFMDMPAGSFFVEQDGKAVMVEGGEYLPSNISIAQTVYEVIGTETPGIITSD